MDKNTQLNKQLPADHDKPKAGDRWLEYIQQYEQLKIYFDSLPGAIGPWLAQQIDIFAGYYPQSKPSANWVKASERLPEKDGYYCFKANGGYMGAYLRTASNGSRWFCDSAGGTIRNWKNCEWLDEQPAAGKGKDAAFAMLNYIQDELFRGSDRINGILVGDIYRAFKQHNP